MVLCDCAESFPSECLVSLMALASQCLAGVGRLSQRSDLHGVRVMGYQALHCQPLRLLSLQLPRFVLVTQSTVTWRRYIGLGVNVFYRG